MKRLPRKQKQRFKAWFLWLYGPGFGPAWRRWTFHKAGSSPHRFERPAPVGLAWFGEFPEHEDKGFAP